MPAPAPNVRKERRRYRNVVRAFYENVWAITPEKYNAIANLISERRTGISLTREEIESRIRSEDRNREEEFTSSGSVALMNVFGVLSQRMGMMSDISGGVSLESLSSAVNEAAEDDNVQAIVLNMDSEGGSVAHVEETAAVIQAAAKRKPVYAIANSLIASGAYWLANGATEIWITPSGAIGSVGVIKGHEVTTGMKEKMGIETQVVRFPEQKAEGAFGELLSEEALQALQTFARGFYDTFAAFVADQRGVSLETVRNEYARVYGAKEAQRLGMVDRIGTLNELLAQFGTSSGRTAVAAQTRPAFSLEGLHMNPEIFGRLVRTGLCQVTATDAQADAALARFFVIRSTQRPATEDEIVAALQVYLDEREATVQAAQVPAPVAVAAPVAVPAVTTVSDPVPVPVTPPAPVQVDGAERQSQIMAAVRMASLPASIDRLELVATLVNDTNMSVQGALNHLTELVAEHTPTPGATINAVPGGSQVDKLRTEARDAMLIRSFGARRPEQIWSPEDQDYVDWEPSANANRSRSLRSLPRLAEACLTTMGYGADVIDRLEPMNIALLAMGLKDSASMGIYAASDGPAYNLSGMFSNILLDASNVILRNAYTEANTTFEMWAGQGDSLPDFKAVNKVIGGEMPDPKAVPEDGEFDEVTYADGKESYKLAVWGEIFSISWQAVVNDSLGEFTAIPAKQGRAMRRKQNKLVYAVLNDNAALGNDSVVLFHAASHSNLTTGAVTDYTAAVNTLVQNMAEQSGITSGTTLNLEPRYLLAPPAIRYEILKLIRSTADPYGAGTSTSNTGTSGTVNIHQNAYEPVFDAQLNASSGGSDTAFYLATDSSDVDTVEYAYLQGLETPALDSVTAFDRLAIRYRIYQAFATAALDYRGLQKHAGA